LLLTILLFNLIGYRLLTSILEDRADKQLETALDNNDYNESELISLKIPVAYLPYYNNSSTFERIDGRVEIQGLEYKYVKRRIYNDSLELLCIPNHAAMKFEAANDEFFRFLNDLQHNGNGKSSHMHHHSKKPSGDYCSTIHTRNLNDFYLVIPSKRFNYLFRNSSCHYMIPEQPPEIA
jgi:hypothetical protein